MNGPVTAFDPNSIDFEMFALFLEARRIHRGKTAMDVAREAGVGPDDVNRAARGRNPGENAFLALLAWVGEPADHFARPQ